MIAALLAFAAAVLPAPEAISRANAAIGRGDFNRALVTLEQIDRASPKELLVDAQFLRAEAYLGLGNRDSMRAALLGALRLDPEAVIDARAFGPELTAAFADVRAASTGSLELSTNEAGAAVFVDGAPAGKAPLQMALSAGRHRVRVVADPRRAVDLEAVVRVGEKTPARAEFAPPESLPAQVQARAEPRSKTAPVLLLAGGGAAVVAGAVITASALGYNSKKTQLDIVTAQAQRDAAHTQWNVGVGAIGVGLVGLGAGGFLLWSGDF